MKLICLFVPCRWIHHFNSDSIGVYQCSRCKSISKGAWRCNHNKGKTEYCQPCGRINSA